MNASGPHGRRRVTRPTPTPSWHAPGRPARRLGPIATWPSTSTAASRPPWHGGCCGCWRRCSRCSWRSPCCPRPRATRWRRSSRAAACRSPPANGCTPGGTSSRRWTPASPSCSPTPRTPAASPNCAASRALAEIYGATMAPHCPLGPISLAASLQVAFATPNFLIQEQSLRMHYNAGTEFVDYLVDTGAVRRSGTGSGPADRARAGYRGERGGGAAGGRDRPRLAVAGVAVRRREPRGMVTFTELLRSARLVAIVRGHQPDAVRASVLTLFEAGVRLVEVSLTGRARPVGPGRPRAGRARGLPARRRHGTHRGRRAARARRRGALRGQPVA